MELILESNSKTLPHTDHIIWLSDIHIRKRSSDEDNQNELLDEFCVLFRDKISELQIDVNRTTYVLISGDVSFSSEQDQYLHIKDLLCSMIPDKFRKCFKFIWCPGNHDVSWSNFINIYYKKGADIVTHFKDRNASFEVTENDKLFEYYTNNLAYKYNSKEPLFCIEDTSKVSVSTRYRNSGLEGYVIDHDSKVMFIIVNSAWYCRGGSIGKFLESCGAEMEVDVLVSIIEESKEAGQLITGFQSKKSKKLAKEILALLRKPEYCDYLKITFMHHPIDWLDPREIHSYAPNMQGKGTIFTEILENSAVLLTGHVHPSKVNRVEYLSDLKLMHFRAPMLINHYKEDEEDASKLFPCNGFGVITIERLIRKFKVQYYDTGYFLEGFGIRESGMPSESVSFGEDRKLVKSGTDYKKILGDPIIFYDVEGTENFSLENVKNGEALNLKESLEYFNVFKIKVDDKIELVLMPKNRSCAELLIESKAQDFKLVKDFIKVFAVLGIVDSIVLSIPGAYLFKVKKDLVENDEFKVGLQRTADKAMNRFRTNFYNYMDMYIEDKKPYIKEVFEKTESSRFSVMVISSEWF